MDTTQYNTKSELWKYIFNVFPIIDLPFGVLCVVLSDNWIFSLCCLPVFPLTAAGILTIAAKYNIKSPGAYVFTVNGIFYLIFQYYSGVNAPGWTMLINVTIGSSFMFENERLGQILVAIFSVITGGFFFYLGSSWEYSLLISLSLISFTILFARTYSYLQLQQKRIETKNNEIEAKNKDITDSINYSRKIQLAVLPNKEYMQRNIPLFFILYKPKDIVSGDFYWFHEINRDEYILVCADCTGHGVPGAFMTVIGSNLLTNIITENKINSPAQILNELDLKITSTLKQDVAKNMHIQDGMDLTLIKVNKIKQEIIFCSARRPALILRDSAIIEVKANKFSLGGLRADKKVFTEQVFNFKEDDVLYLFTDGYIDQFGGKDNKKFMIKRFRELILACDGISMVNQLEKFTSTIDEWIGKNDQTDDILVMGIKF